MQTFTLTGNLTGNKSTLSAHYNPPISLDDDSQYALGLISFETYNAIPNIDKGANKFYIGNYVIEIPTGSYELSDINSYIEDHISQLNPPIHCSIKSNNNALTCIIKSNAKIDFQPEDSIRNLLGFDKVTLEADERHESNLPVNILKTNAIRIECNITTGAYNNNLLVHTIHEFFPSVPPGFKIIEVPQNVIYMPVNTKLIDNIILNILDQDGKTINFRGEVVTARLHLKRLDDNYGY